MARMFTLSSEYMSMVGREIQYPVKGEILNLTLRGKEWKVVSNGQMRWLLDAVRQDPDSPEGMTEEAAREAVSTRGYAVLKDLLGMMSPAEREQWQAQYRYGGIIRKVSAAALVRA